MISHEIENASVQESGCIKINVNSTKGVCLVYSSRIICVGTNSTNDAIISIESVIEKLRDIGYQNIQHKEFKLCNMVAKANCGFRIDVNSFCIANTETTVFDEETQSCRYSTVLQPNHTILVYPCG